MAIAGLVMGILSVIFGWVPVLGWILVILGIIFSAIGIKQRKGMGITGLVLSIIGLIEVIAIFVIAANQ